MKGEIKISIFVFGVTLLAVLLGVLCSYTNTAGMRLTIGVLVVSLFSLMPDIVELISDKKHD